MRIGLGDFDMREYIPKNTSLPRWVYKIVLETVRGYDDMVKAMAENEYDEIHTGLGAGHSETGSRGRRSASRPTETKALNLISRNEEYAKKVRAVEQALNRFPEDVRSIILNNIKHRSPLRSPWQLERDVTLGRKKRAFVILVAEYLDLI